MANPPQGRTRQKEESSDTKKQMSIAMKASEFKSVRPDDTTIAEKRPCFAQSAERHILDKQTGFGEVKKTMEDHTSNRGLDTLSSDTRNAPLAGSGAKIDIDTCMPNNLENQNILGKEARENVVT